MTNVTYNGVVLRDVQTEDINYETQRDSTGVDPIGLRVTYVCSADIAQTEETPRRGLSRNSPAPSILNSVIAKLNQPRRRLVVTVGNVTLLDIAPSAVAPNSSAAGQVRDWRQGFHSVDIDNGPAPHVNVLNVVGEKSMRIRFRVVCMVASCDDTGGPNAEGIINFRFWLHEDIDGRTWATRRTYQGRLRVVHQQIDIFAIIRRLNIAPPLQRGFRRQNFSLNESNNGLELDFSFVDQEESDMPPEPATDWQGDEIVSTPQRGGQLFSSNVSIQVQGRVNTSRQTLAALAVRIIDAKLDLFNKLTNGKAFLEYASIGASLNKNSVQATARILHTPEKRLGLINHLVDQFALPLDEVDNPIAGYKRDTMWKVEATALAHGLVAALQTPCHPDLRSWDRPPDRSREKYSYEESPGEVEYTRGDLEDYDTKYKRNDSAYLSYDGTSEYDIDDGTVICPVAESSQGGSSSSRATSRLIRLHRGLAHRVVIVDTQRLNEWPELPDRKDFTDPTTQIRHQVVDYQPRPSLPVLSADGRTTLHASGLRVVYALDRVPEGTYPVGKIPFRRDATDSDLQNMAGSFLPSGTSRESSNGNQFRRLFCKGGQSMVRRRPRARAANASAAQLKAFLDLFTAADSLEDRESYRQTHAALSTRQSAAATYLRTTVSSTLGELLVDRIQADNPQIRADLDAALPELVRQMVAESQTVLESTVTATVTPPAADKGTLTVSVERDDGGPTSTR